MRAGQTATAKNKLDHLACRYYRFYLKSGVSSLKLDLRPLHDRETTSLKAEVVEIGRESARADVRPLKPVQETLEETTLRLSVELTDLDPDELDHIVLVVSNCGHRGYCDDDDDDHDDGKIFEISAAAL
jgi:hypothetical protein